LPPELADHIEFRPAGRAPTDEHGILVYPQGTGAIQVRPGDGGAYRVCFWHPGADGAAMAPFEIWFWKESFRFAQAQAGRKQAPAIEAERLELKGGLDPRSGMATALVLFGLFFVCVYLLPSLTCEERERGVLLAQALSPATTSEILTAKFFFYPVLGLGLAVVLAGTYRPVVLTRPFFWLALIVAVFGSMGIGLTIASLARTQRAASMGAMCYTGRRPDLVHLPAEPHRRSALSCPGIPLPAHAARRPDRFRPRLSLGAPRRCGRPGRPLGRPRCPPLPPLWLAVSLFVGKIRLFRM
jgi:hypothetical protein